MEKKDTKQEIFETALELFGEKSYRAVSMREIAHVVGIKESSIYNHYKSKEEILDSIFREFKKCMNRNYFTKREIEEYIKKDSPRELLWRFVLIFPDEKLEFMMRTYRIIFTRQFIDPRAREYTVNTTIRRVSRGLEYALNRLMHYGKIPLLDTKQFSRIWADSLFAEFMKIIYVFNENREEYSEAREEYFNCAEYLIDVAISGINLSKEKFKSIGAVV